jgi:hypothetical protein
VHKIIFHVGIPKTGSTALQVFLAKNSEVLHKSGCDYFEIGEASLGRAGRISSGNGAYLARSVLPANSPARMPNSIAPIEEFLRAAETSTCQIGVVSSELFVDAKRDEFEQLLHRLRNMGITPVVFYFIREQDQFLSSSYIQQVKRHGLTVGPDKFARDAYRHIPYLKYATWFSSMEMLFGRENILCRTYEGAMHNENGIFGTFCQAVGISSEELAFGIPDVNTGMSIKELLIMTKLNKYQPRMRFSDLVVENSQLAGEVHSGETYNLFSSSLRAEISEFFREENLSLATSYFNRTELFFVRMKEAAGLTYADASIDVDDVIAFAGGLLVRFDERLANLEGRVGAAEGRIGAAERRAIL